jgi:hypothetical protein
MARTSKPGIECLGQAEKSRAALDRFKQLQ